MWRWSIRGCSTASIWLRGWSRAQAGGDERYRKLEREARRGEGAGPIELRAARGWRLFPTRLRWTSESPSTARPARVIWELGVPRRAIGDRLCLADFWCCRGPTLAFRDHRGRRAAPALAALEGEGEYLNATRASLALETARPRRVAHRRCAPSDFLHLDRQAESSGRAINGTATASAIRRVPTSRAQRLLFELLRPADSASAHRGDMIDQPRLGLGHRQCTIPKRGSWRVGLARAPGQTVRSVGAATEVSVARDRPIAPCRRAGSALGISPNHRRRGSRLREAPRGLGAVEAVAHHVAEASGAFHRRLDVGHVHAEPCAKTRSSR